SYAYFHARYLRSFPTRRSSDLVYNVRGDYRMQPENGNLPQRLAALPMSIIEVPLPPTVLESWQSTNVWNYGRTFFYERGMLADQDRKSTRLNSSHVKISYAVFC